VEVSLVFAYNAVFVAPVVAVLALRQLAGDRAEAWLASGSEWLRTAGQAVVAVAVGAVGTALMVLGVGGLLLW
jgi:hypothetical protein